MKSLSQSQKFVLLALMFMDIVVIGVMAFTVYNTTRRMMGNQPTITVEPTQVAQNTPTKVPTWTPSPTSTPRPTLPPAATKTPTPTPTPFPTRTPTPSPTPVPPGPVPIEGGDFDYLMPNRIPGWEWDAYVNFQEGDEVDSENSYAEPMFFPADDPERQIDGTTLKVETRRWVKFRTWVHQTVTLTADSTVYFEIKAQAFSSLDRLIVKAGIDPTGPGNCYNARWGEEQRINQENGIVTLRSPRVIVPQVAVGAAPEETDDPDAEPATAEGLRLGRVTICFFAEPTYPHVNNAAFFDEAVLIAAPPR